MKCKNCGTDLTENDKFCTNCGTPAPVPNQNETPEASSSSIPVEEPSPTFENVQTPSPEEVAPVPENVPPVVPEQKPEEEVPIPVEHSIPAEVPAPEPKPEPVPIAPAMADPIPSAEPIHHTPAPQINNAPSPVSEPKKDNSSVKYIVLGLVVVLALAAIVAVVYMLTIGKKESTPTNNTTNNTTNNSGGNTSSGNGSNSGSNNNPTQTGNKSGYKIKHSGYELTIPRELIYLSEGEDLVVTDEDETWYSLFTVMDGSFSQLKRNISRIAPEYESLGYDVEDAELRTIGGIEFITMEISYAGDTAIYAYAALSSTDIAACSVVSLYEEFDYDIIEDYLAGIIDSAVYIGDSYKAEIPTTNFNVISGLIVE